jgi:hypothetical protein
MALLALWMPATSLCLAENAGLFADNDHCGDSPSSETSPCCALASAAYKMDESGSALLPSPSQVVVLFTNVAVLDSSPHRFARVAECGVSPPELSTTWQFSYRAAPAPRAPSSAS